ncbi:hypothetical protein ANN_03445 [Periplaneta americana]|uniref:DDE-1 domain-containing protein n=1 Tax=Periplaneta americana TaxID=6978 RepID=A0ABQ8TYY8_PERAM|nr:hypothetical protein ANN_03445 [Periplaneta americana]
MIHAGGEQGFIPNALVMWKAHQTTGDYHKQMNWKNYEKWVRERLVPNLKPNSVVVLGNSPYHNIALGTPDVVDSVIINCGGVGSETESEEESESKTGAEDIQYMSRNVRDLCMTMTAKNPTQLMK